MALGFEKNTPTVFDRLEAMHRCAEVGYSIRAVLMPIIPVADWQDIYSRFLKKLLNAIPLSRITLGSICSYPQAQRLMELKLGKNNAVTSLLDCQGARSDDGRLRFSQSMREQVYRCLINLIRQNQPDLEIGLCLEDESMFEALNMYESLEHCNCVL